MGVGFGATVGFMDPNGIWVPVKAGSTPLPISGGGGQTPTEIESEDGSVLATTQDGEMFRVSVTTETGEGIFRILDVGGLSALLTNEAGNPLSSSWSPSGIVVHQDLDIRIPKPPATGTFTLQSENGLVTWVSV